MDEIDIIGNDFWLFIGKMYAGVRKPQNFSDLLILQRDHHVSGIVSLLDDTENLNLYEKHQIKYIHIPIKGGSVPSKDQVAAIIAFQNAVEGLIAVHCTNGRRRTGTVLGAIYIELSRRMNGQTIDADHLFNEMKSKLLLAKPDCDLRDAQWSFLHASCLETVG